MRFGNDVDEESKRTENEPSAFDPSRIRNESNEDEAVKGAAQIFVQSKVMLWDEVFHMLNDGGTFALGPDDKTS